MRVWRLLFSFVAVVCAAGVAGQNDSYGIDDILNTPSSLHGRVEKKGGLDPVVWDALWHSNRNEFMTWVRQSARERPQEPPAPYQCQLFINHKYKYIYVRHPKTGSSSIFIRKLGGRCGKDTNKPTCMVQLQHGTDPDKARQWWNEYLVFTFVRNPWSRAASGLQFLSAINHSKDPSCTTTFQRFCQDPNAFGRLCRSNDSCCKFGPMFDWLHLQGQAQCMFTADGLPAVDFIGRSENSEEDFQDLVAMINDRLPPGLPRVQGGELGHENTGLSWVAKAEGTDLTKARRKYKNRYSEEYTSHPECIEALRRVYRKDVEWLGYSNSTGADLAH